MHLGRVRLVCRHRQEIRGRAASQVPSSAVGPHSCLLLVTKCHCVGRFEGVRVDNYWPLWMESRLDSDIIIVSKKPLSKHNNPTTVRLRGAHEEARGIFGHLSQFFQ